jgi:hypothetical protein
MKLRKRIKETIAVALGMLIVFGALSAPLEALATSESLTLIKPAPEVNEVFWEGEFLGLINDRINRIIVTPSTPGESPVGQVIMDSSNFEGEATTGDYYAETKFFFPHYNNTSYSEEIRNGFPCMYICTGASATDAGDYGTAQTIYFGQYYGAKVTFNTPAKTMLAEGYAYISCGRSNGDYSEILVGKPSTIGADSELGELIGWSTNPDYLDQTSTGYFCPKDGTFSLLACKDYITDGTLNLYAVYEKYPTTLEIKMDSYFEDATPTSPTIVSTNRPSNNRAFSSIKYYEVDDDEREYFGTTAPGYDEYGRYVVVVTMAESGTTQITNGALVSRKYTGVTAEASFRVYTDQSVVAATDLVYNGENQFLVNLPENPSGTISFSDRQNGTYTTTRPTGKNAGEYSVWYKVRVGDETAGFESAPSELKVTIAKAENSLTKAPVAKSNLEYTGSAVELIEKGTAAYGTVMYSMDGPETGFTATVPKATQIGEYKVYYMVEGDTNHEDIGGNADKYVTAKIEKKTLTLNWSNTTFDCDEKMHCPSVTLSGVVDGEDCTATVSGQQKNPGTYTATVTLKGNDVSHYKLPENSTVKFTINDKKNGSVSVSMGSFIYGGASTTPVVTSSTHDASKAVITYKASGAPDSAYSSTKPTGVGTYTVRAQLPENDRYKSCAAFATFTISYLPVPEGAFEITGKRGYGGWYTSEVQLIPSAAYEISVGDRSSFKATPITLSEEMAGTPFYIRKKDTGEQTAGVTLAAMQIDVDAPTVDMENDNIYFCDEEGKLLAMAKDKNLDKIYVDGEEVEITDNGNGGKIFELPVGKRKQSVSVKVVDKAGNEKSLTVITAPAWMKDGIIGEGEFYLETGTPYKTPSEGTCYLEADGCDYLWGIVFYARSEGDHTFHLH